MIEEFIPYEQALQLKELEFDLPCFATYGEDKDFELQDFFQTYETFPSHIVAAPTFSQAFRFFREKYDLQLWLGDGGMLSKAFVKITGYKHDKFYFSSSEPMEYEEAELYGLMELIKIAKENKQQ